MKADAELIAKVLDGRATADERARLLAEADQSPELMELLADAAAITSTENAELGIAGRRVSRPALLGIGIGLLAAAVTVFMVRPPGEVPPFPTSVGISNIADARAGATVPGSRGAADDNRALQSVIIGARLTDYQVLGLDTARETAAAEIAHALRSIPGGGVAAANFEPAGGLTTDIVSAVESVVDVRIFRSAQWLELTRLAAAAGDWRTLERPDLNGSLAKVGKPHADRIIEQIAARGDTKGIADLATEALSELSRR